MIREEALNEVLVQGYQTPQPPGLTADPWLHRTSQTVHHPATPAQKTLSAGEYVKVSQNRSSKSEPTSSHILACVPAVEHTVRRSRTTAHAHKHWDRRLPPSSSVAPAPSRAGQPRTGHMTKRDCRTDQTRSVGLDSVSAPFRGRRSPRDTNAPNDARRGLFSRGRPKSYWRDPLRHLPSHVAKHNRPVALELFSGSGRWSVAWRMTPATRVFELDIRRHLKNDWISNSVQRRIRGWIRSGLIAAVWMGTPCNSFSRARDRPGGPPPLRSDDHPNGLPMLRALTCAGYDRESRN